MESNYTEAGYGKIKEIGYGLRPAIVVVDFQLGFTDPAYPLGRLPMVQTAVENTARLLRVARAGNIPVAKSYTAYHSSRDMPYWKVPPVIEEFIYEHPCTRLDPRIHDEEYDFTFCKAAPSVFFNSPLMTFLVRQQVDTVIITGCTTSGCVRASIVDAFSYGFRVIVPEDCNGDAEIEPHRINLEDCGRRYADITGCNEVIAYLQQLNQS